MTRGMHSMSVAHLSDNKEYVIICIIPNGQSEGKDITDKFRLYSGTIETNYCRIYELLQIYVTGLGI